jgi:hypothetical protein
MALHFKMNWQMKSIYKYLFSLLSATIVAGLFTACSDDDSAGKPMVTYVRVTDPASSDSLLVAGGQGQMIAIIGQNLETVRELWFNDLQASLNPNFITSTTVITRVPTQIPLDITNELKMVFANGDSIIHNFEVEISEPAVDRMKNEWVAVGEEAVIYGDYFYAPLTVTFTGDVQAEIVSLEDQEIHVTVPEGAQSGPVTVSTNFGVTKSNFWFRDDRNLFGNFEGPTYYGWWHGPNFIKADDPVIQPVNEKFLRVKTNLSAGAWYEFFVGEGYDIANETAKIPDDAILNPEDYSLKFELNTLETLAGAKIQMYVGNAMGSERNNLRYIWEPNLDTADEWQTVSIPFNLIIDANPNIAVNPAGYGISFWFWQSTVAVKADFALDNMRVVPNVIEE